MIEDLIRNLYVHWGVALVSAAAACLAGWVFGEFAR